MPNQPKTPHRTIRIADELWDALKVRAEKEQTTVSELLRRAALRYLGR